MKRGLLLLGGALTLAALSACESDNAGNTGPAGQSAFLHYVAIGANFSMGVQSDGVLYTSQRESWTALLAHQAFATTYTQPLIQGPGCFSPYAAPLQLFRRLAASTAADTACALFPNVTLPTQDVAIEGANTYDALRITPESTQVDVPQRRRQYPIVLPAGKTQVTAMMMQNPTLVSVELGATEVLNAMTSGLMLPATAYRTKFGYVPFSVFQPVYAAVLDSVAKTGAKVLLVGVPNVASIVSFRTGDEIWQDRVELRGLGIVVTSDCSGSPNLLYVPKKIGTAVSFVNNSARSFILECSDFGPNATDNTLTPDDVTTLTSVVNAMNDYIRAQAAARGWAFLDLDAVLRTTLSSKPPYSVGVQYSCTYPYGQYISLDGLNPNVQGYQLIANAAADALNATYNFSIAKNVQPVLTNAQVCP